MTLSHTIDRDTAIVAAACVRAFQEAGIPTSVAVEDPECLARMESAMKSLNAELDGYWNDHSQAGKRPPEFYLRRITIAQQECWTAISAIKGGGTPSK